MRTPQPGAASPVLVTGGAGVVGSYVVRDLVARGDRPAVVHIADGTRLRAELGGGARYQPRAPRLRVRAPLAA